MEGDGVLADVVPPLDPELFRRFVAPRSVVIVGASSNPAGFGGRASVNLFKTGYSGTVHLVNPGRAEIAGHPTVPSVAAIGEEVEAAIVLVGAGSVLEAVRDCAAHGIRAITVCTAGFGELGPDGRATEAEIARIARDAGCRAIGPNCIGVLNVIDNYVPVPTYNVTYVHTPGGVTMISQSGGMAVNLFNRAQGREIGIRALVTLGNEADIELAELVEALVADEQTTVIALFLERLADGERFIRAARAAYAAGKPIVALKVGRSEVGQRSVAGHTGRLAGEPELYAGVFEQTGVIQVATLDELLDTAYLLARLPRPRGRRVGVFTVSGGESSYFADEGSARGLEFPMPADHTVAALHEIVRFAVPGNPFDATGQIIGDPAYIRAGLEAFCADPNFDLIALTTATWGEHDADQLLPEMVAVARRAPVPTIFCSWAARNHTERAWEILRASGVPAFETSDAGVAALGHLVRFTFETAHVGDGATPRAERIPAPPAVPGAVLDEAAAKPLLAAAGVPVVEEILAADRAGAHAALASLGGPVVVKLLVGGVVHKSDAGLVRLGIADAAQLDEALDVFERAAASPSGEVRGILVQRQHRGVEMILGGVVDPNFGPALMIGAGGILAEHERDVRFVALPATRAEIEAAVRRLRVLPVLEGLRGAQPDLDAFLDCAQALGRFVDGARDWLASCDLNPVLVGERGHGAVAVDAAIVLAAEAEVA
jgi:acetate---CoA ligase (ADP-forming)